MIIDIDGFNTNNMISQQFAFPAPIMYYICKNPYMLIKLYKCSKFFYHRYRHNIIIGNFEIIPDGEPESFTTTSTKICVSNPALPYLKNLWITDSFICRSQWRVGIIPERFHCTIKKLELNDFILWKEFEILTKAGTVKELKIKGIYSGRKVVYAPIDDIIPQVPNATSIEISECFITTKTFASIPSLKQKARISNFVTANIDEKSFRFAEFLDFLMKNASSDCNVQISFKLYPPIDNWSV